MSSTSGRHQHAQAPAGKGQAELSGEHADDRAQARAILQAPLYVALGLCLGCAWYYSLPFEPALSGLAIASIITLIAYWRLRRMKLGRPWRILALIISGIVFGAFIAKVHTSIRPPAKMTRSIGPTPVEGWVTDVEPGANGNRLRLNVHAVAGEAIADTPRHIRLTHKLSLNVEPGRFVRCYAVLRPPPQPGLPGDYAFNRQAYFEGLEAVGYVQGRCRGGTAGVQQRYSDRLAMSVSKIRRGLAQHVRVAAGERAGGFAAALTSGDRSFMPQADVEALRNSGLAHLLAISGLHLGLVGGLVYFALRRSLSAWEWFALRVPVQKPAALVAILSTFVYLMLSGASISTQRAFIMAAVFFGAILLDRAPISIRSFSVAMGAVIVLQPHSVMSPGFQMSFAATGALIATYEGWSRSRREKGLSGNAGIGFVLKSLVVTSIIGAAATAPFALYHFDRLAPYGLAANILAMPIITFISGPMAGLALVAAPFGLSDYFLRAFGWSLERVLDIAYWASGSGEAGISLGAAMPGGVLLCLSAGLAGLCLSPTLRARAIVLSVATMCSALAWGAAPSLVLHWSASGDVYVNTASGDVRKLGLVEADGLGPLRYSDLVDVRDCADAICKLTTPAGNAVIGTSSNLEQHCTADVSFVISDGITRPTCFPGATYLSWTDQDNRRGASIMKPAFGSPVIERPGCGHRPWAPCLHTPSQ